MVRECLEGHREAAGHLVDRYQKPLFNVALRMLGNDQDSEDVTQTVFLNAFAKLTTYDPKYRFFSWVYRMTVNESLNALKKRKKIVTLEDFPVQSADAADDADRIDRALMQLKPDDRTLIVLKHFLLFSYEQIGDVLEIPVQTVKSRLFTARERLRTNL